ncbi:MAG: carboxypeptidase-like regulatory domain-containing protein [Tannerellaceae bacterium]|jgi:hypothetical protein|nr:carboxypeptidase-like regulatory domain-containing protein [Tannerellaceae bacterium]
MMPIFNITHRRYAFRRLAWLFLLLLAASHHLLRADDEDGLERRIRLPKSKGTVYELLEKVTQRSGYLFIYDNSVVNNEQSAYVKKGEYTIRQAIYEITGNLLLSLRITGSHILIQPPGGGRQTSSTLSSDSAAGHFTISGTLLDRYTREPVAYATVGIPSDAIGTVANLNGDFRLRLPDSLRRFAVSFSHTGYLTQEFEAGLLSTGQTHVFLMEPRVISLQEVVVRLSNPLRLLHDMLANREANYSKEPVYFTSFYREGVERKKGIVNLTEAIFRIYKTPYADPTSADQVKLLKMRRISNEKDRDTLITKIKSGINASLMLDVVKNLPDFLLPENELQYNYLHSDITVIDNRTANIISFEQKKEINEPLYRGELILDAKNDALLSARFEIHPRHVEKATGMLVTRKSKNLNVTAHQVIYNVSYKPWNGTYYANHIRGDLYFRIRKRNQFFGSTTIHTWFEIATCKIETTDVSRFTRDETLRTRTVFADTNFTYDADFWGDFNIILPEEKLGEAISRITSKIEETGY